MKTDGVMVVVLSVLALLCSATHSAAGVKLNQLMVKYGVVPKRDSFFDMPRNLDAAKKEGNWAMDADLSAQKGFTTWCRNKDYRVCLLYDQKGSVAGIQVSHSVADLKATGVPQDFSTIPDWIQQVVLGTPVYSAIAYFVDPSTLPSGGRLITKETPTAQGIWIEQARGTPMKIPFHASELETTTKYTKQGCLPGQGQHYFYNLKKESGCVERGPYFMLYEANGGTMLGLGIIIFGKTSQLPPPSRQWFINVPAIVANVVTPNGPQCTGEWMKKYGATSLHVFFREQPWLTGCTPLGKIVDGLIDINGKIQDMMG